MSGSKGGFSLKKITGKFDYNSPVILTYALICVVVYVLNFITGDRLNKLLFINYPGQGFGVLPVLRCFLYIFGHANLQHLTGNMTLFLLVGPIAEERYGSKKLMIMIASTAVISAVINNIFIKDAVLGASGIVFLLIVLSAFGSSGGAGGKIPITLVLVCVIWIGGEITSGLFQSDNVSQMGHITGGVCGIFWGFMHKKLLK